MVNKTIRKALLIAGLAVSVSSPTFAADKPALMMGASASMLSNTCSGCHGDYGASVGPASPIIAGISKEYFIELMQGFANGEVPSTIMGRIAKGYTEDEITLMADFYGDKPFVKAKQEFNDKLVKKGGKLHDKYCEKCHSDGGQSAEDDSGILAGQWTPYLKWSLADYTGGHREMTKKMAKKLKKLVNKEGDKGIDALLAYYASQQ